MISKDLRPGAILRCIERANGLILLELYVLTSYRQDLGNDRVLVRHIDSGRCNSGSGWFLKRFELVHEGNGEDYQPPGDGDLVETKPN